MFFSIILFLVSHTAHVIAIGWTSVHPSVRHTLVLCRNGSTYRQTVYVWMLFMAAKSNKSYIILHVMSACVAVQDKHQLDRIFELEAQMSNLTSTVTALSQNIESANTKVPCLQFGPVSVSKCPITQSEHRVGQHQGTVSTVCNCFSIKVPCFSVLRKWNIDPGFGFGSVKK